MTWTARICAPHFTCGVEFEDDTVVRTAPIVRYMLGWSATDVGDYVRHKGWRIETLRFGPP